MSESPPNEWAPPAGDDPLLRPTRPRQRLGRGDGEPPTPSRRDSGANRPVPKRRNHPARGARVLALAASVTATVGITGAMALADGGDDETLASTSSDGGSDPGATESSTQRTEADTSTIEPATSEAVPAESTTEPTVESTTTGESAVAEAPSPSAYGDGVWAGTAEYTEWGDVQVEVTITAGQIADIAVLQVPSDRKSSEINARAVPVLTAQAIEAQSADLDIVSGATYSSRTYADSLQAALDQATLAQEADGS